MSGLRTISRKKLIICLINVILVLAVVLLLYTSFISKGTGTQNVGTSTNRTTSHIDMDIKESIIVLQVGEKYKLDYSGVTYESNKAHYASVSLEGEIEGVSPGTTSVILKKDGKICASVIVIVNEETPTSVFEKDRFGEMGLQCVDEYMIERDVLTKTLQQTRNKEITITDSQKKLTSESLYQLNKKKIKLTIDSNDYQLCIDGNDIDDHSKSFDTKVNFGRCKLGYTVKLNTNKKLPGKVYLKFKNNVYKTKYIYGFNNKLERYELISDNNKNQVLLSKGEKYLLTNDKLYKYKIDSRFFIALGAGIVLLVVIYIVVKKRYWFW